MCVYVCALKTEYPKSFNQFGAIFNSVLFFRFLDEVHRVFSSRKIRATNIPLFFFHSQYEIGAQCADDFHQANQFFISFSNKFSGNVGDGCPITRARAQHTRDEQIDGGRASERKKQAAVRFVEDWQVAS